jgi:hypothetical protein
MRRGDRGDICVEVVVGIVEDVVLHGLEGTTGGGRSVGEMTSACIGCNVVDVRKRSEVACTWDRSSVQRSIMNCWSM